MTKLQKFSSKVGQQFTNFGNSIGKIGDSLTSKITKPAITAGAAVAGITFAKGFQRLTGIDNARAKLVGLGHDGKSVEKIMNSALTSVKGTAFGMDEAATTAASAVAAGIEPGKELTRYLSLTGDAAAIAGISLSEMGSIINSVQTSNKAYNGDLQQLANRGLPVYQWLAEEAGVTADAIFDMASKGEISSEMLLSAIENNIGGAAKKIGEESFTAGIANMWAAVGRLGASFLDAGGKGGGFFSTLKPLIGDFTERLDSMGAIAEQAGVKFGEMFIAAIEKVKEIKRWYDDLSPTMQNLINKTVLWGAIGLVALGPILNIVSKVSLAIGGLFKAVGIVINGFKMFATVITFVVKVFMTFSKALMANPWALAIAAAIAVVILVIKNWGSIVDWIKDIWSSFKEWIGPLWESIKALAVTVWEGIKDFLVNLWTGVVETAKTVWTFLVDVFAFVWELVKALFESAWTVISSVLLFAWNAIVALTKPIWEPIVDILSTIWDKVKNVTSTVWESIKSVTSSVWNVIKGVISSVANAIKSVVVPIWNAILSVTSTVWNSIKNVTTTVWDAIKTFISVVVNGVKAVVTKVWNVISSVTTSVWGAIKNTTSSAWNGARNIITGVVNGIKTSVTNVWNNIKSTTSRVWNSIKTAMTKPVESAKNTIKKAIDSIKGFFNGLKLKLPKIQMPPLPHFSISGSFGFSPPSVPRISVSWWAKGGIFSKPTLLGDGTNGVGEAGPEAVLPLNSKVLGGIGQGIARTMGGGLESATVNNENNVTIHAVIRDDKDIDKLAYALDEKLNNLGNRRRAAFGG